MSTYSHEQRAAQLHTAAYNAALETGWALDYYAPKLMVLCPLLVKRENVEVPGKFNPTMLISSVILSNTKGSVKMISRLLDRYEHEEYPDSDVEFIWRMVLDKEAPLPMEDPI